MASESSVRSEDQALIAAYLDGEPEAVATVELWISRAAGSYRRRLANVWDDVLQEIHVEVFKLLKGKRFRGRSSLRTYLWRVVGHSCLDRIRKQERWQWTELEEGRLSEDADLRSRAEAVWSDSKDLLRRVLGEISEECRRLWSMIVAGLSYREMSDQLDVAAGTLRVRVLRCRRRALEIRSRLLAESM